MPKVEVELGIRVRAEQKLKNLAKDLQALGKMPGVSRDDVQRINQYAQGVRAVTREQKDANKAFSLVNAGRGVAGAAVNGAGLGRYGALAGMAGVAGAVSAVAGIAAQLAKMQYQFLETTTKSAATLSMGSENFRRNLEVIQKGSFTGGQYGYTQNTMAAALANFGSTSGTMPSVGLGHTIAQYGRASGYGPEGIGSMFGGIAQYGGDPKKEIGEAFDYAMTSGAFGRQMASFTAAIAGVTQQLMVQNPGLSGDVAQMRATRIVGNIASLGGIYATAGGNAAAVSALSGLGNSTRGNPMLTRLALASGVSPGSIALNKVGPEDALKMAQTLHRQFGGKNQLAEQWAFGGLPGGSMLYDIASRNGFSTSKKAVASYNAEMRASQVNGTTYGGISKDLAQIVSQLQKTVGDDVLTKMVKPTLDAVAKLVTTFDKTGNLLDGDMTTLGNVMIALTAVEALKGGAGIIGRIAPLVGGGTALAGALGIGAMLAVPSSSGITTAEAARRSALTAGKSPAQQAQMQKWFNGKPNGMAQSDWDTLVKVGAEKGINPHLLAAVDQRESSYGATLDPSGRGDGGHGYGRFQLDDRTPGRGGMLGRARLDYGYAASIAANMLNNDLAATHGDLQSALNMYNSGQATDAGSHGGNYGSDVSKRFIEMGGNKLEVTFKVMPNRASVKASTNKTVPRRK